MIRRLSGRSSAIHFLLVLAAIVALAASCSSSREVENVASGTSALGNCTNATIHPQALQVYGTVQTFLPGNGVGAISVPQASNSGAGSWGSGSSANLTLVYLGGGSTVTCTYAGQHTPSGGVTFTFTSCSNGAVYGQQIVANEVDLTLSTPDSMAFADFVLSYGDNIGNPCSVDTCPGGVPTHDFTARNGTVPSPTDGDLCSTELCSGGTIVKTPISLNESNPCMTVTCDSAKGIVETPIPNCGVPSNVSPIGDSTVVTDFANATSFVYSSANQPGRTTAIDPNRVSILRGQVLQPQPVNNNTCPNTPCGAGQECMADSLCHAGLQNVTVSILNGSGYGSTLTRADGWFDMAVNGGAPVVLQYNAQGYLPVQRRVDTAWRDYSFAPDVVMIQRAGGASIGLPVAAGGTTLTGTAATDADGARTTRAFLPAGLAVTNQGFSPPSLTFRLTEYTVGLLGPKSMPGDLPPSSAYTYAFEASMDEAEAANIPSVTFNSPISLYVENFLKLPVGAIVPMGSYDRTTATWKVEQNGQVINVFDVTGDNPPRAKVSIDPNALTTEIANYGSIGMLDDERRKLAATYNPSIMSQVQLWRAQVTHFTPFDENLPPANDGPVPDVGAPVPNTPRPDPCTATGSIIECENQILAEELPIVGTPYTLRYQSERSRGAHPTITIPITGTNPLPTNLKRVDVEIAIAGSRSYLSYPASSLKQNESVTWAWDRLDGYGRLVQGTQPGRVTVVWVYDDAPGSLTQGSQSATSFGGFGTGVKIGKDRTMRETYGRKWFPIVLQAFDALPLGFGGWSLSAEHVYEPFGHSTWLGDGRRFTEAARTQRLTTAATHPVSKELYTGIAFGADGTMYTTSLNPGTGNSGYVFSMSNGVQTQLSATYNSSNNVFTNGMYLDQLALGSAMGIAVSPDGSLYIADQFRIIKASPPDSGGRRTLTLIAGSTSNVPATTPAPDRAVAAGTPIGVGTGDPLDLYPSIGQIALAPDGTVYFASLDPGSGRPGRVRRIRTDGLLDTVAGTGSAGQPIVGCDNSTCSANQQPFSEIYGVALGTDGSIYFSENNGFGSGNRVWRVSSDGILHPFAGGGSTPGAPSGVLANSVTLRGVHQLAFAGSSLYFAESGTAEVNRRVDQGGYITTIGGRAVTNSVYIDNVPPQLAYFEAPTSVVLGPDGAFYSNGHDYNGGVIGHIQRSQGPQDLVAQDGSWLVPSDDGQEVFKFDAATGRHTATLTGTRGTTVRSFSYTSGLLTSIADVDGTTIITPGASTVTITAPHGQVTTLSCGGSCATNYLTSFQEPTGAATTFTYTNSQLSSLTDPLMNVHTFSYDGNGYLLKDLNPLPGSGGTLMSRTPIANGWTTSMTTPEGRIGKTDTVDFSPSGLRSEERKHVARTGVYTKDDRNLDGSRTATSYSTTNTSLAQTTWTTSSDPRYNLSLPFTTSTTSETPVGSHRSTRTNARTVAGGSPTNPFTFTTITDTSSVTTGVATGPFTRKLDVTTNPATLTVSSPGTTLVQKVDTYDRVTEVDPQGVTPNNVSLYPTAISYTGSRISQTSQGVGPSNDPSRHTYTLNYGGPHAELSSIDTPLGSSTISFGNWDADGRPQWEGLPGNRVLRFGYDANGNRTSFVEPGNTTHYFSPNQVNLLSSYAPPSPWTGNTNYN